jgi:hypothetical protein
MLNLKLLFIFVLFKLSVLGQVNLVPNPSFESYTACPNSSNIEFASGWFSSAGSVDYFNSCATNSNVGVPSNYVGFQLPKDGNAYAGIVTYYLSSQREYIGVQLTQSLSIGVKYFVSAYVSKKDISDGNVGYSCSSNNFGFKFSKSAFTYTNPYFPNNSDHFHSPVIINDSINWQRINGTFISDSSYKYLMIGNFHDNANTNSNCTNSLSLAYYYVDQICVSTDSLLCELTTTLKESNLNFNLKVFVNTFSKELVVESINIKLPFEMIVYNFNGQELIKQKITSEYDKINISNLNSGLLIVKVLHDNKIFYFKLLNQ